LRNKELVHIAVPAPQGQQLQITSGDKHVALCSQTAPATLTRGSLSALSDQRWMQSGVSVTDQTKWCWSVGHTL